MLRKDTAPSMSASADSIQSVLRDMVSLEAAQSGRLKMEFKPVELSTSLRRAATRAFRSFAMVRDVTIGEWGDGLSDLRNDRTRELQSLKGMLLNPGLTQYIYMSVAAMVDQPGELRDVDLAVVEGDSGSSVDGDNLLGDEIDPSGEDHAITPRGESAAAVNLSTVEEDDTAPEHQDL